MWNYLFVCAFCIPFVLNKLWIKFFLSTKFNYHYELSVNIYLKSNELRPPFEHLLHSIVTLVNQEHLADGEIYLCLTWQFVWMLVLRLLFMNSAFVCELCLHWVCLAGFCLLLLAVADYAMNDIWGMSRLISSCFWLWIGSTSKIIICSWKVRSMQATNFCIHFHLLLSYERLCK